MDHSFTKQQQHREIETAAAIATFVYGEREAFITIIIIIIIELKY